MSGKKVLQSLLRKRVRLFDKHFNATQKPNGKKAFEELLNSSNRLRQFLSFNEPRFSKRVLEDSDRALGNLTKVLENVRSQTCHYKLASHFIKEDTISGERKAKRTLPITPPSTSRFRPWIGEYFVSACSTSTARPRRFQTIAKVFGNRDRMFAVSPVGERPRSRSARLP